MRRVFLIVGGLIVIVAIFYGVLKINKMTSQTDISLKKEAQELLEYAKRLEQNGKYKEACKIYQDIQERYPQYTQLVQEALRRWEDLNIKILFSAEDDEFSIIYTVKPGDTLSKIAKKYNTTVELIKKSNSLKSDVIKPGQKLKVCNTKFNILVDKSQYLLMLKAGDKIIKTYKVSIGKNNSTPIGEFKIVNRIKNPQWFDSERGRVVPAGSPDNVLGKYWLGLNKPKYGIHGTNDPASIGKPITKGCIRMRNEDIEELFIILPRGTQVKIIE